jgi:glycosyltransferase involved in cell wall biosynthesis
MNILILSWRDLKHPNAGGAEISTLEHAKAWVKAGHKVFWFSSYFKDTKREEKIDGVRIVRKGRQFFDVQIRAFFWYFFGDHPKFDLVVDQFHGLPFFTPFYVGVKKLAFIHEVAKEVWRLNPWPKPFNLVPAFLGPILEPIIFTFYRNAPFMTVSKSTADNLVLWGIPSKNITIVQNGVDRSFLPKKLAQKEDEKTALYLGAISEDKGIKDAFCTFSEINKIDGSWQFWVVGKASENYLKWMQKEKKQLAIEKSFKYWGFVDDREKFEFFARAHVLVNPSAHEGWGLVNIEANSVGTPIVGYDVAGMRDSVKNGTTGLLCKYGDYRSLAKNAIKLVGDHKRYKEFQDSGLKWARKFKWEKATKESLKLIESL